MVQGSAHVHGICVLVFEYLLFMIWVIGRVGSAFGMEGAGGNFSMPFLGLMGRDNGISCLRDLARRFFFIPGLYYSYPLIDDSLSILNFFSS